MQAKMTEARTLVGPNGHPCDYTVGEIVTGKTARVAVANGWAEEIEGAPADAVVGTLSVEITADMAELRAELDKRDARISELEARAGDADDEAARASVEAARVEADGILAAANEDAAKIVDEAKAKAAEIVSDAEADAQKALNAELDRLKAAKPSGNGKK